MITSANVDHFS